MLLSPLRGAPGFLGPWPSCACIFGGGGQRAASLHMSLKSSAGGFWWTSCVFRGEGQMEGFLAYDFDVLCTSFLGIFSYFIISFL